MYYVIYKIVNNINNKEYIGAHQTADLNDTYMGSGMVLHRAFNKYGKENFSKEIIHTCNSVTEMYNLEAQIVNDAYVLRNDTYNLKVGGIGGAGKRSQETKQKISNSTRGEKSYWFGRTHSEETKQKISIACSKYTPWNKGIKTNKPGTMLGKNTLTILKLLCLSLPKIDLDLHVLIVKKKSTSATHGDTLTTAN